MKQITLPKLPTSLQTMETPVEVEQAIAVRAGRHRPDAGDTWLAR
jgi:hypothetical protein